MERKQWITVILAMMFCAVAAGMNPMRIQAADVSDQNAYRAVFDAKYYYETYPDVAAACGMDTDVLFSHYVNYGVKEGRSASAAFNAQAYRQRYADLQAAYGNDMAAYCRHYVIFGKSEGRNASADGQTMVSDATAVAVSAPAATIEKKEVSSSEAAQQTGAIGTCTTSYEANVPRATNVQLAAQRINGVVIQPGGSFSFSNTILARTSENGYVTAPIFISGKKGMGTGGGVCQVSSTLYAAMVYAGLPATERHAHSLQVDYLPAGLDATIAGNYLDLKFTNTFSQPLLIQASADNGTLTVSLVLQ